MRMQPMQKMNEREKSKNYGRWPSFIIYSQNNSIIDHHQALQAGTLHNEDRIISGVIVYLQSLSSNHSALRYPRQPSHCNHLLNNIQWKCIQQQYELFKFKFLNNKSYRQAQQFSNIY